MKQVALVFFGLVTMFFVPEPQSSTTLYDEALARFAFLEGDGMYCSGVIVETGYVVTAGHCVGETALFLDDQKAEVLLDDDDADFALLKVPTPPMKRIRVRLGVVSETVRAIRVMSPRVRFHGWGRFVGWRGSNITVQMRGWPGMSGTGIWGEDGAFLGLVTQYYVTSGEPADLTEGPAAALIMSRIRPFMETTR